MDVMAGLICFGTDIISTLTSPNVLCYIFLYLLPFVQGNSRSAGFTKEERKSFEANFLSKGFVDTFRKQHPDVVAYSYWGYRHNCRKTNRGMSSMTRA